MPVEVVSYMLASEDIRQRLQFQIILQCAHFIKGLKKACITNINRKLIRELPVILQGTGIDYKILVYKKEKYLVFFYRKEEFAVYVADPKVREFLKNYGYEEKELEKILLRLSKRICKYSKEELEFPHEIGAFLDYPLKDVEGFIQNDGKNSLLTGYWKVYHNPGKAKMTFLAFDKAKDSAVNEFLTGKSIREIAKISA